ncbi:uncharacterized protein LOC116351477, partial [Contarinia nasturtii]|uniref:uncharacterized protein LOC116351477 n=1 Tax=Contarinia nasturtii TaxID=265458 RepID=UPI0012D48D5A
MNVLNFLNCNSLEQLKSNYPLRVKQYPKEGLIVLNYLNSSKASKISNECRGLILSTDYKVISRSFDRFFNYNEKSTLTPKGQCHAIEKIDGSIIKIYHFNGNWHVSTRGTAFAECTIPRVKTTYKQAVFEALGLIISDDDINEQAEHKFQQFCQDCGMNIGHSYILELTGKSNRIVTEYNPNKYELWLLGIRCNDPIGKYIDVSSVKLSDAIRRPTYNVFENIEECIERSKNLTDFKEGFVVYDQTTFEPILKVKSPKYVQAHNIGSMGENPIKNYYKMILNGESTEFLAYFPHFKKEFDELDKSLKKYFDTAQMEYEKLCKTMQSDTDFKVFDVKPWKQFAIKAFKNKQHLYKTFLDSRECDQLKFITQHI